MLGEFLAAILSFDLAFLLAFAVSNVFLLLGIALLASMFWEGNKSVSLLFVSAVLSMLTVDLIRLSGFVPNMFHFFVALIVLIVFFEADKPKSFMLAACSMALFFFFL